MAKSKTKIFLSHSSADEDFARELATRLSEAGFGVWSDQELLPGENWAQEVAHALDESKAMVVLLSPDATRSPWINREIEYALSQPRFEGRLFPIMVKPTPSDQFPWILRRLNFLTTGDPKEASREVVRALSPKNGGSER